jgi:HPt (histidine-containing phosphotransfer) domain-containing protein
VGGTSLSVAKGVIRGPITPFVPQGVPPNSSSYFDAGPKVQFAANVSDEIRSRETAIAPDADVFDPELALSRCFGSNEMLREMIQCFFEEVESVFPQMRAALEKGDLVEVGRLGHRMKGTVVYLGAQPAEEAAHGAERFCKSSGGTHAEAKEAINALMNECLVLKAALTQHPLAVKPKGA